MNKVEIGERIAGLEADKKQRDGRAQDQAFDVLWRALDAGLCPGLPPIQSGGFSRCEKALLALDARLTAGTDTDADRAVLASLPADALAVWIPGGAPAREFVGAFAKVYRLF